MADPTVLVEQREQFAAKQAKISEVLEMAKNGKDFDFSRANVLKELGASDAADATQKFKALNREIEALGSDLQRAELKFLADKHFQVNIRYSKGLDVLAACGQLATTAPSPGLRPPSPRHRGEGRGEGVPIDIRS